MTNRRQFIQWLGVGGLALLLPESAMAKKKRRRDRASVTRVPGSTGANGTVIVVGGGMAGATVAKYLRLWGGSGVQVTLIDRAAQYYSCILSNLVLNGTRQLSSLTFGYDKLVDNYGIKFVNRDVVDVDPTNRVVYLSDGTSLSADKIVLAPGVEFDTIPGLETEQAQAAIPHAWKAGPQTITLRNQIAAMKPGGIFILTIPPAPYRCPPGPYERACVVADYLKRNRPGSKVVVLDANPQITAEKENFTRAFQVTHAGVVEYYAGVQVLHIDPAARMVETNLGVIRGDVVNAIPPHRAGKIIAHSGLNNVSGKWAGVDVLSYESSAAPDVHVIGDSSATTQPKAGHIANAEAKVCADAITREMRGENVDPAPVTNSSCYSPITATTASWLSVVFAYDPVSKTMKPVGGAATEADHASTDNFEEMLAWFQNLMADSFA